jgi:sugar lactone lactonase YvrE
MMWWEVPKVRKVCQVCLVLLLSIAVWAVIGVPVANTERSCHGLAAQAAEKKSGAPISLVWPLPPEKPRIKWLESISTSRDIGADKQSALQRFVVGFEAPKIMMEKPYGITVDREGRIYVTDTGKNPAVHVFDKKAKKAWQIGAKGRVQLQLPIGVAVDDQEGTVWVSDAKARVIYAFAINGDPISAIGQEGEFQNPTGLAIDPKRRVLYVADSRAHVVKSYRLDGTPLAPSAAPATRMAISIFRPTSPWTTRDACGSSTR